MSTKQIKDELRKVLQGNSQLAELYRQEIDSYCQIHDYNVDGGFNIESQVNYIFTQYTLRIQLNPYLLMKQVTKRGFLKGVKVEWWGLYGSIYESGESIIKGVYYDDFNNSIMCILENKKQFVLASNDELKKPNLLIIPDYLN